MKNSFTPQPEVRSEGKENMTTEQKPYRAEMKPVMKFVTAENGNQTALADEIGKLRGKPVTRQQLNQWMPREEMDQTVMPSGGMMLLIIKAAKNLATK